MAPGHSTHCTGGLKNIAVRQAFCSVAFLEKKKKNIFSNLTLRKHRWRWRAVHREQKKHMYTNNVTFRCCAAESDWGENSIEMENSPLGVFVWILLPCGCQQELKSGIKRKKKQIWPLPNMCARSLICFTQIYPIFMLLTLSLTPSPTFFQSESQ